MGLEFQFRCNCSDGYLAWNDRVIQVRETANTLEGANYEFKVCGSATELKELIHRQNRLNNKGWITTDLLLYKAGFERLN